MGHFLFFADEVQKNQKKCQKFFGSETNPTTVQVSPLDFTRERYGLWKKMEKGNFFEKDDVNIATCQHRSEPRQQADVRNRTRGNPSLCHVSTLTSAVAGSSSTWRHVSSLYSPVPAML